MYLLGLDVETTGLDAEKDMIIEIGAVLWEVETAQPVKIFSEMIKELPSLSLAPEIVDLTGITSPMLNEFGLRPDQALFVRLLSMMEKADAFVAHNAPFDRGFLEAFFRRYDRQLPQKPWICTIQDVAYPAKYKSKSLIYLAAVHGFVNPFSHRAVTDVLSMLKVLSHYDISATLAMANSPTLEVIAKVSYENRNLAKDAGFRWDAEQKQWKLTTKKSLFRADSLPFAVEIIEL